MWPKMFPVTKINGCMTKMPNDLVISRRIPAKRCHVWDNLTTEQTVQPSTARYVMPRDVSSTQKVAAILVPTRTGGVCKE